MDTAPKTVSGGEDNFQEINQVRKETTTLEVDTGSNRPRVQIGPPVRYGSTVCHQVLKTSHASSLIKTVPALLRSEILELVDGPGLSLSSWRTQYIHVNFTLSTITAADMEFEKMMQQPDHYLEEDHEAAPYNSPELSNQIHTPTRFWMAEEEGEVSVEPVTPSPDLTSSHEGVACQYLASAKEQGTSNHNSPPTDSLYRSCKELKMIANMERV